MRCAKNISVPFAVVRRPVVGYSRNERGVRILVSQGSVYVARGVLRHGLVLVGLLAACCMGCGARPRESASRSSHETLVKNKQAAADHDHGDWWCAEHGVPEEVCTRCNSTLIATFRERGDWCDAHDRPDSQCFPCHPELEAKFAARYAAKFGSPPAPPTDP